MKNRKLISFISLMVIIISFCYAGSSLVNMGVTSGKKIKESKNRSKDFILNSETYKFDGIKDSLNLVSKKHIKSFDKIEFIYNFISSKSGYGNRSGKILKQVLTSHFIKIIVRHNEILYAVMDGRWDMQSQQYLEKSKVDKVFKENEKIINVSVGEQFNIVLPSNRTTGYAWYLKKIDESLIVIDHQYYDIKSTKLVGSSGYDVWILRPIRKGKTKLDFEYKRDFGKNKRIKKKKEYKVIIE